VVYRLVPRLEIDRLCFTEKITCLERELRVTPGFVSFFRFRCVVSATRHGLCVATVVGTALTGCGQGGTSRIDLDAIEEPERIEPQTTSASENEQLALAHQATMDPVPGLSDGYAFDCEGAAPSRVLPRLNRFEYDNTVRDLLSTALTPARAFPKDDFGDSFDNNAQALTVSPLLTEAFVTAAAQLAEEALTTRRDTLITCDVADVGLDNCARQSLTPFLTRAFRRPLLDAEISPYVELVRQARDEGASFDEGIQIAVEAALLSVNFLFRVEFDVEPDSTDFHALTQYELATRLSYFLWSSMPDDELMLAAQNHELQSDEQIVEQVERMLADPKAEALSRAFAGRWLETNDIADSNQPAEDVFEQYTPELKHSMEEETRLLLRDVLTGELPFEQLLTTDESHLDARLADFYGVAGEFDSTFRRVSLADTPRRGLLGHGSVLTLTAAPTRTSPTRRGVYVLSNLLCAAPPPPPPNVQGDLDKTSDAIPDDLPFAERARLHADDPQCAGCHALMDPIGFGLERFDAIGRYRTEEFDRAIDASGELATNGGVVDFDGAVELGALLAKDDRLPACATQKLYTYAMSRLPELETAADQCRIDWLRKRFSAAGHDFTELLRMVVLTDAFRGRAAHSADSDAAQEE